MIQAKDIHKYYGDLEVLKGVNINVKKGEVISIVGASGAGKTTLLQILGTLDQASPSKGFQLKINDTDIQTLSDKGLANFRNKHIGFIFQFHQLLPEFTAIENVSSALNGTGIPTIADGGIRYSLRSGNRSQLAISTAAVASLYNAGEYDSPMAEACLRHVFERPDSGLLCE